MQKISNINELRQKLCLEKERGLRIGFVPTMGFLHAGHLSLVEIAKEECDVIVVSIFVNPTQFNNPEDLEKYPRDEERDLKLLKEHSVNYVFTPEVSEIYKPGHQFSIKLGDLATRLEGQFRPGHFEGMATVVTILFNITSPYLAVFGEKDFQQLRIIEELIQDLKFDIKIVRGATLREVDGLAMSSRNVRLTPQDRERALLLSKALIQSQNMVNSGQLDASIIINQAKNLFKSAPEIKIDYISIVDEESLNDQTIINQPCRMLIAAWVGGVRLIDNIALKN